MKFIKTPEDTYAKANALLGAATRQFDAAAAHARAEEGKQQSAIDALSDVIISKRVRAAELRTLAKEAQETADTIGGGI